MYVVYVCFGVEGLSCSIYLPSIQQHPVRVPMNHLCICIWCIYTSKQPSSLLVASWEKGAFSTDRRQTDRGVGFMTSTKQLKDDCKERLLDLAQAGIVGPVSRQVGRMQAERLQTSGDLVRSDGRWNR
jgi:hypothetical protein